MDARALLLALCLSLGAVFVVATSAHAATVSLVHTGSGDELQYEAAPGESNDLTVIESTATNWYGGRSVDFLERGTVAVVAGAGCIQDGSDEAVCGRPAGVRSAIDLGDQRDLLTLLTSTLHVVAHGGDGTDVFWAGGGSDHLYGDGGDDLVHASYIAGGPDVYSGGGGSDAIDWPYSTGGVTTTLDGTADDGPPGEGDNVEPDFETVIGSPGNDTLVGSGGAEHIIGGGGVDSIDGAGGDDVLSTGTACGGTVSGGAGNDTITSGGTISGGPDDDTLAPSAYCSGNTVSGGDGTDTVDFGATADGRPLSVSLDDVADDGVAGENDNVRADVENVNGGSGPDVITGSAAANVLDGRGGDDVLDGGAGADTLIGSFGEDVADYSARTAAVTVRLDGTPGGSGEAGEGDTVGADVEDAWTGSGDDLLVGGDANNVLDGGPGADTLVGGGGEDVADYSLRTAAVTVRLDGTPGGSGEAGEGDTVGADVEDAWTGSGDDLLVGNDAANVLDGGPGADTFVGRGTPDTVDYSTRTDPVNVAFDDRPDSGEAGEDDTLGPGMENAYGGEGDDVLTGDDAANLLDGGGGDDQIDGGAGDDTLLGGPGDDSITGGLGSDVIDAGLDDDEIAARDGVADTIACGYGDDYVVADGIDALAPGECEQADLPPQPAPASAPPPAPPRKPLLTVTPRPVSIPVSAPASRARLVVDVPSQHVAAALRRGILIVVHGTPAGGRVSATATVTAATARALGLAHARRPVTIATLPSTAAGSVRLRLTRTGRRLLSRARSQRHRARILMRVTIRRAGFLSGTATGALRR